MERKVGFSTYADAIEGCEIFLMGVFERGTLWSLAMMRNARQASLLKRLVWLPIMSNQEYSTSL